MSEQVIYVVRSWPRLSRAFIVNEVLALEQQGVELAIFSLARSGETLVQPQVAEVRAPVIHLEDRARLRGRARRGRTSSAGRISRRFMATALFALRHPGWPMGMASAPRASASCRPS